MWEAQPYSSNLCIVSDLPGDLGTCCPVRWSSYSRHVSGDPLCTQLFFRHVERLTSPMTVESFCFCPFLMQKAVTVVDTKKRVCTSLWDQILLSVIGISSSQQTNFSSLGGQTNLRIPQGTVGQVMLDDRAYLVRWEYSYSSWTLFTCEIEMLLHVVSTAGELSSESDHCGKKNGHGQRIRKAETFKIRFRTFQVVISIIYLGLRDYSVILKELFSLRSQLVPLRCDSALPAGQTHHRPGP